MQAVVARHIHSPVELNRYLSVRESFRQIRRFVHGRILDFGASYGLSMLALREIGLDDVDGVEIEAARVNLGWIILREAGADPTRLLHVPETRHLPYQDATFGTVVANAVLEHIPQPRAPYLRELWRVLQPGGCLIVAETPNKYLPYDYHTTHMMWVPWLPSKIARAYAIWRGRYRPDRNWAHSGWRGLGYYELVAALPRRSYRLMNEESRPRHRWLRALRLPASLLDPYPLWILRKLEGQPARLVGQPTHQRAAGAFSEEALRPAGGEGAAALEPVRQVES